VADPRKQTVAKVRERLGKAIPKPVVELDFVNPWQLLVATMLAAQSTDKTINKITPELFRRWPTPAALAAAPLPKVEQVVRSSGYFRQKARAIVAASQALVAEFGGVVPEKIDELVTLPGVARKTANVVIGSAYGVSSGIVVDTHCGRVSRRLGLTKAEDPVEVEEDLCRLFARRSWIGISHRFILHGRYVCLARKPRCGRCPLCEVCPSAQEEPAGPWTTRAAWERALVESRGTIR
jgi:endonuclease-3